MGTYLFFQILVFFLELHYVTAHLTKLGLLLQAALLSTLAVLHQSKVKRFNLTIFLIRRAFEL